MTTQTDVTECTAFFGLITVNCDVCDWTQRTGAFTGAGTPERPGCADYIDEVMPLIGAHIDSTGHDVLVDLTTFTPGQPAERSITRFLPRTTTSTERTTTP